MDSLDKRKAYKAKYYQDNKDKIRTRRKDNWAKLSPEQRKSKSRHYNLKSTYGISLEDYESRLLEQNSVCAICSKPQGQNAIERLYVDHCHSSGKVRGLLCFKCNTAIGHLNDDPSLVAKALDYLQKY